MRVNWNVLLLSTGFFVAATTQALAQGAVGGASSPGANTTPPLATNNPGQVSAPVVTARRVTAPVTPRNPALALAPAPHPSAAPISPASPNGRVAAGPSSYWGPAPPPVPQKKPNAVRRLFNRVGSFLGADEELGTTPSYRDVSTGRTNTINTKPWMKQDK